jgi:hypothetical protein
MTSDRNKPGVAFWATVVLVVVLVAYPASYGPWHYARARWFGTWPVRIAAPLYVPLEIGKYWGPQLLMEMYAVWGVKCMQRGIRDRQADCGF